MPSRGNRSDILYALHASSGLAALEPGVQIHSLTVKTILVGNSLIDIALHLYGRAFREKSHLDKAVKLIQEIPCEPSIIVWRALLGACVLHNDIELGRTAAKHVLEMDPQDEATHVLLSNIYATVKR
ncbi:hypothetical protein EV1_021242 [Malus domestica]